MTYEEFIEQNRDFFATAVDIFFEKVVELAKNKKCEEALEVGNDALLMAKYSNIDYAVLYLIGLVCEVYFDNDQPEMANDFFKRGMKIIHEGDVTYERDLNQFLDLKIIIDEELKKKNGLSQRDTRSRRGFMISRKLCRCKSRLRLVIPVADYKQQYWFENRLKRLPYNYTRHL